MIEWTDGMKARLLTLVADKVIYSTIAVTMTREFRRPVSKGSAIGMARRLLKPEAYKPQPKPTTNGPVKLDGLTAKTCRWPLGPHHQSPPYLYCGSGPSEGSPYCPTHSRIAYNR